MRHFNANLRLEQYAGDVRDGSGAKGGEVDLAWMGLDIGNKLGDRTNRDSWIHFKHQGRTGEGGRHREVANNIEMGIGVGRGVAGVGWAGGKRRMAGGRRGGARLGRDVGGGAWSVLDDKWLAKPL